jgi:RimJ/RimL family protein N-acetyltransferase
MTHSVSLRDVTAADIPIIFAQQSDPAAIHMAAFVPARDKAAHQAHWTKILNDDTGVTQTIEYDGQVAGFLVKFVMFDEPEVGYWIGRDFWGKGIATQALAQFLAQLTQRPLFAHAAKDNHASLRVLQKCGFEIVGYDRAFADARGEEIDEVILKLA